MAIESLEAVDFVDHSKKAVTGISQGGGLSIAVGRFLMMFQYACPMSPFFAVSNELWTLGLWIPTWKSKDIWQHTEVAIKNSWETLGYFDAVNFAKRANVPALFSAGLLDEVCPPSTVFAAFNHYKGEKQIECYPFNGHEGGQLDHLEKQVRFLNSLYGLVQQ